VVASGFQKSFADSRKLKNRMNTFYIIFRLFARPEVEKFQNTLPFLGSRLNCECLHIEGAKPGWFLPLVSLRNASQGWSKLYVVSGARDRF
jgi:hypothetical protein